MPPPHSRFHIRNLMVLVAMAAGLAWMARSKPVPALGIGLGIGTRLAWRVYIEVPFMARGRTPTEKELRAVQRTGMAMSIGVMVFVMVGGLLWEVSR
jgi:hypothetical protein